MTPVDGWTSWLVQCAIVLVLVGAFGAFLWWSERDFQRWLDRMYPPSNTNSEPGLGHSATADHRLLGSGTSNQDSDPASRSES